MTIPRHDDSMVSDGLQRWRMALLAMAGFVVFLLGQCAAQAEGVTPLDLFRDQWQDCGRLRNLVTRLVQEPVSDGMLLQPAHHTVRTLQHFHDLAGDLNLREDTWVHGPYRVIASRPEYSSAPDQLTMLKVLNRLGIVVPTMDAAIRQNDLIEIFLRDGKARQKLIDLSEEAAKETHATYQHNIDRWVNFFLGETSRRKDWVDLNDDLRALSHLLAPNSEYHVVEEVATNRIQGVLRIIRSHFAIFARAPKLAVGDLVSADDPGATVVGIRASPFQILRPTGLLAHRESTRRMGLSLDPPDKLLIEHALKTSVQRVGRVLHTWRSAEHGDVEGLAVGVVLEPGAYARREGSDGRALSLLWAHALVSLTSRPDSTDIFHVNQYFDVPKILYTFGAKSSLRLYRGRSYAFQEFDLAHANPEAMAEMSRRMHGNVVTLASTPENLITLALDARDHEWLAEEFSRLESSRLALLGGGFSPPPK